MLPRNILVFVTKEIVNWTTIKAIKTPPQYLHSKLKNISTANIKYRI